MLIKRKYNIYINYDRKQINNHLNKTIIKLPMNLLSLNNIMSVNSIED